MSVLACLLWAPTSSAVSSAVTAAPSTIPPSYFEAVADEFAGPFSSWGNVKTRYGAKGDGISDDTNALQTALDDVGKDGSPFTIYLPAGTYRITKQLNLTGKKGVGFIGQDASVTKVLWAGPAGGNMLVTNGSAYVRYGRITWDGANKAAVGIAHWYYTPSQNFASTVHEHADEVFMNMQKCLVSGKMGDGYGQMDSEIGIFRDKFQNCSVAGVSTESFNALDVWIWDSEFDNNGRAVTNEFGAGNFDVYRSVFRQSTVADITMNNTQTFAFRNNVSTGSQMFLSSKPIGANSAQITVQGNRILDTHNPIAIDIGSMGPLMLIDNQFRSLSGATGPVAVVDSTVAGCSLLSVGNSYTVPNPIKATCTNARVVSSNDKTLNRQTISSAVPAMPHAALAKHQIFEVPPGASSNQIQAVINQANTSKDSRPIVHFPAADFTVGSSLVLPPNRAIQLVGDSMMNSSLNWTGAANGTVIKLLGPTKVSMNEISINGADKADGVVVTGANQKGARIYSEFSYFNESSKSEISFDNVPNARGEIHGYLDYAAKGTSTNIQTNGASIAIYGGGTTSEHGATVYSVNNGGKLLAADMWFEGAGERQATLTGTGTFTMQGAHVAPADSVHGGVPTEPAFVVNNFKGNASFLNIYLDLESPIDGAQMSNVPAGSNAYFLGVTSAKPNWYHQATNTSAGLGLGFVSNPSGTSATPNVGVLNAASINAALAQTRSTSMESTTQLAKGVTDFRAYRVQVTNALNGIRVLP